MKKKVCLKRLHIEQFTSGMMVKCALVKSLFRKKRWIKSQQNSPLVIPNRGPHWSSQSASCTIGYLEEAKSDPPG